MENDKHINLNCQLTITARQVTQLLNLSNDVIKNIEIAKSMVSANDEIFLLSQSQKGYSAQELSSILKVSTVKEVNRLTKKLGLNNEKYGAFCINNSQEFRYNEQAVHLLKLFLKFELAS